MVSHFCQSRRAVCQKAENNTSPPHEYIALHQQGNRVGIGGGAGAILGDGGAPETSSRFLVAKSAYGHFFSVEDFDASTSCPLNLRCFAPL